MVKLLPVASKLPPTAASYQETVPVAVAVSVVLEPGQIDAPLADGAAGGGVTVAVTAVRVLEHPLADTLST